MENKYLAHYGVLGMRWGHRTSTQLTADKNNVDSASNIVRETKNINNTVKNARSNKKKQDLSHMSDAELKAVVSRMNLEKQYSTLSPAAVSKGHEHVNNTLEVAGSALAITSSALAIALTLKQLKEKAT